MPSPRHVLLLSADQALSSMLPNALGAEGFAVSVAAAPPAALPPPPRLEALLLDAALGLDPAALLAPLGGRPLLALGGTEPEALPKPVRVAELAQRLRARLAAWDASPEAALPLGPFAFHPGARVLWAGEARIRLTETEAAILSYLLRAGDRAVPREELLGEVWGYSAAVATHTLETHVYRLRRKLGDAGALLRREAGGYRLA